MRQSSTHPILPSATGPDMEFWSRNGTTKQLCLVHPTSSASSQSFDDQLCQKMLRDPKALTESHFLCQALDLGWATCNLPGVAALQLISSLTIGYTGCN